MKKKILLSVLILSACATKSSVSVGLNANRSFQFKYSVDVESTEGKKLELWIPIPKSNEVQIISNLKLATNGLQYTIEDEVIHGNKYLYINDENGIKKETNILIIFEVMRYEHQNIMYKNVDPQKYLGAYRVVPIGGVFEKIIEDNNLSKNNTRNIYDFVLDGMHYGKPISVDNMYYKDPWLSPDGKYGMKKVDRDSVVSLYKKTKKEGGNYTFGNGNAIYACDIGVGNCTDYHSYFMSLDRTIGVPTRFHMGFPIPSKEEGIVRGYHCWADYYVEGKGWYPVDISEADKNPDNKDYYFGTVDYDRVEMMIGRDFILKGYEQGTANLFIYPLMEVNDKKSSAFTNSFTYNNIVH